MQTAAPNAGRPRRTDPDAALESAMRIFWAHGYEGASVGRLARGMGVPRAGIYRDHGCKRGLFLASLDRYGATRVPPLMAAFDGGAPPAKALRDFLGRVIDLGTTDPDTPGCLISCVLADAAGSDEAFRAEFRRRLDAMDRAIADRLRAMPRDALAAAPDALAPLVGATARGLMLRARAGDPAAELLPLAATASRIWCNDPAVRHE